MNDVDFIWIERNLDHIAKHDVRRDEAEYVVNHGWPTETGDEKQVVRGQTAEGRYLQVIFVFKSLSDFDYRLLSLDEIAAMEDDVPRVYVIHARDLTAREKRNLRKRG
jgi:hypothetical protein